MPSDCDGLGSRTYETRKERRKDLAGLQARPLGRSAKAFGLYRRRGSTHLNTCGRLCCQAWSTNASRRLMVLRRRWMKATGLGNPKGCSGGVVLKTWSTARNREYVVRAFEGGEQCGYRAQAWLSCRFKQQGGMKACLGVGPDGRRAGLRGVARAALAALCGAAARAHGLRGRRPAQEGLHGGARRCASLARNVCAEARRWWICHRSVTCCGWATPARHRGAVQSPAKVLPV